MYRPTLLLLLAALTTGMPNPDQICDIHKRDPHADVPDCDCGVEPDEFVGMGHVAALNALENLGEVDSLPGGIPSIQPVVGSEVVGGLEGLEGVEGLEVEGVEVPLPEVDVEINVP